MRIRDVNKELAIREKALKLIVKEGFDGFSMQKLARLASVSPATLYIYYEDKEDLIIKLATENVQEMFEQSLKNFSPNMAFAEGLRIQWKNRAAYGIENPDKVNFMEQVKHSHYHEKVMEITGNDFSNAMKEFVMNAIQRGELVRISIEVLWSVAYAPLYNLIRFHNAGQSVGGRKFQFSEKIMDETFALVLKALTPEPKKTI